MGINTTGTGDTKERDKQASRGDKEEKEHAVFPQREPFERTLHLKPNIS